MVFSALWTEIDPRLSEIFSASIQLPFAELLFVVIGLFRANSSKKEIHIFKIY